MLVREAPDVRTVLHLGDLRYSAPAIRDGRHTDYRKYLRVLDQLLESHGIQRLLLTPGNHDWWEQLHAQFSRLESTPYRISQRIWALPRGFKFCLGAATFMSFGGAASLNTGPGDRNWSRYEVATPAEVGRAVVQRPVDVLLTHEAPNAAIPSVEAITRSKRSRGKADRLAASAASRSVVDQLLEALQPRLNLHGHMHVSGENAAAAAPRIYSLAAAGSLRNMGVLDLRTLNFTWLP